MNRSGFVARMEAGDAWGDAANATGARWTELCEILAKGRAEHEAGRRTKDAAFYRDCMAGRAKAKAKLRDVMKLGTPTETKNAGKMLDWLEADAMPEPEPIAARIPHVETWSEESKDLADDLLRSLVGGESNPPRGS